MDDQISGHFKRREFACKCGCGQDSIDIELIGICETVRAHIGVSITPTSGNRCKTHNTAVGGGKHSQHLLGRAADLPVGSPVTIYNWLCERYPNSYGFGLYETFVHVDSRLIPARWDGR